MSKSRKRLRKAAMLGIGLLGASKLMGMKADLASKALKGDQYAKAKKAFDNMMENYNEWSKEKFGV
mgnify:CR=1 FL=1